MTPEGKDHLQVCPECETHYLCRERVCRIICATCERKHLDSHSPAPATDKAAIDNVIFWKNGMVMVFDGKGQQMPQYQGRASEMIEKIIENAEPGTRFCCGDWKSGTLEERA